VNFLDPKTDIAFKKLFSNAQHTDILINFLNSTLSRSAGQQIVSVAINDPYNHPEMITGKSSIVDVRCTDQSGAQYIIEMQVVNQKDFAQRCQYYVALALSRQLQKAEDFIKLTPVIFIGILNYNIFQSTNYLSHHAIVNLETGERTLTSQEYHFVELKKFDKQLDQLDHDFDKWVYFFKNAENLQTVPTQLKTHKAINEAFDILERSNWTLQDLAVYEKSLDLLRERFSQIMTAREEGELKGRLQGDFEARYNVAKQLLDVLDVETIAQKTGLSIAEVEKLKS